MNEREFLNKKVKGVDERFEVVQSDSDVKLLFNGRLCCWVNCDKEILPSSLLTTIVFTQTIGWPLFEIEQLTLKGVKVFCEAYNNRLKEYFIWINYEFSPYHGLFLNLDTKHLTYDFGSYIETDGVQTKFTEEEIANMPIGIQKGIEYDLLVKEEVDE